ncbi:MAG: tetratricopeptide repeat protein [Anaerolineales bacterium]|nr:tetratricopeptide repeat protein [Anaerolineales bacterium]
MRKVLIAALLLTLLAAALYQIPEVNRRLSWRMDIALTYLRGVFQPADQAPMPLPPPAVAITSRPPGTPIASLGATDTPGPSPTPPPTPTPLPRAVSLPAPAWEEQDINNCGPAALAMYLRFYGWEGDQFDIADLLKPQREDRNVNVEELAYYVRTRAGWLNVEYRVGGDLNLLKAFLAASIPIMIEESFYFEAPYWPNDDLWAAHYNLLTGYDDAAQTFTSQDSFHGADQKVAYATVDEYWQAFNRVYILVFPPDKLETVKAILGEDWDADANREHALLTAEAETQSQPDNAFAWFNLGTNLVYFERYPEAALAYDRAREIGLPQRMLRYQFGPFFAYFHTGRMDDLMALVKYALQRTPTSEEAYLWRGWGYYRQGKVREAVADFETALAQNPLYQDARYALDFVRASQ